jgi:hypothetical protein
MCGWHSSYRTYSGSVLYTTALLVMTIAATIATRYSEHNPLARNTLQIQW